IVWVCPPHTSISLYWRPGSHSAAIFAASAWAFSASRNSSTNRIVPAPVLVESSHYPDPILVLPTPLPSPPLRHRSLARAQEARARWPVLDNAHGLYSIRDA